VSRDADVRALLKDSARYSNRRVTGPVYARQMGDALRALTTSGRADERLLNRIGQGSAKVLIDADPPDHRRQRASVAEYFTPRAVATLEPVVRQLADSLVESFAADGVVDIATRFARPLPMRVIADQLAVGDDDLTAFYGWSDAFTAALGNHDQDDDALLAILDAQGAFFEYFAARLDDLAANPADHLLGAVARACDPDGVPLTRAEQLQMCAQFVVAGNETTAKTIAMAIRFLATTPGLADRVRGDRTAIRHLIEETLRLETPSQGMFRQAREDVVVAGQPIPAGDHLFLAYGSANRDASRFDHPDDLDLERPQAAVHLGFGAGEHFCLGAHLARLEAVVGLEQLLERLGDLSVDTDSEQWDRSYFLHGLSSLRMRFTVRS
jgi:cytochrome P450